MNNHYFRHTTLVLILCVVAVSGQAQNKRYKVIQGLSYLHTQVSLIINNWEVHPLSTIELDKFSEEYKKHFIEEIEHDEEWVEFMLVDENWNAALGDNNSKDVEKALNQNLLFYRLVYELIQKPETVTKKLPTLMKRLEKADNRLYQIIFPALIGTREE